MGKPEVTKNDDGYTVVFGKDEFRVEVHKDNAKNEKEAVKEAEKVYDAFLKNPLKSA